ncbi:hypothetical protein ACS0TY_004779 [Phlomoides rotata]
MKFMDGNKSWNLLKLKVFTNGEDCPPELEHIGRAIAGGCRGLPLAVVLVAGVLSTVVKTRASWEKIAKNERKNINSVVDRQLDEILSLSYMHLPHHLRPCFLFMATFPEDHSIRVLRLIKLWVAEGFLCMITRRRGGQLESLNLEIEATARRNRGRNRREQLRRREEMAEDNIVDHEVDRALGGNENEEMEQEAQRRGRQEVPNAQGGGGPNQGGNNQDGMANNSSDFDVRRGQAQSVAQVGSNDLMQTLMMTLLDKVNNLSTQQARESLPPLANVDPNLKMSQPLPQMEDVNYMERNNGQGGWYNQGKQFKDIASTMKLVKTGIIFCEFATRNLEDATIEMDQLMENLHTLFLVRSFACGKRIMKMFPNLKKLGLVYYEDIAHHPFHNLKDLHQLENLKIIAKGIFSWERRIHLVFPRTLKHLSLVGGKIPWKDMSICLNLKDGACDGDTWETTDGEFPQLQYLRISGSDLQHWITEDDPFPRLKCLVLYRCPYLNEIPDSIGEIPTLDQIKVDVLNRSLMKSAKEIQRVQREYGNEAIQAYCIHMMR